MMIWIVSIVLVGAALLVLSLWIGVFSRTPGVSSLSKEKKPEPQAMQGQPPPPKKRWRSKAWSGLKAISNHEWWARRDLFPAILGFIVIWLEIWSLLPEWWRMRWEENIPYLVLAASCLFVAGIILPKPKEPYKYKVAKVAFYLGVVVLANFLLFKSDYSKEHWERYRTMTRNSILSSLKSLSATVFANGTTYNPSEPIVGRPTALADCTSPEGFLPENPLVKETTVNFWKTTLGDYAGGRMIDIAERESNFNQFEPDGITPYRGRQNCHDVGAMQINETYWLLQANALGYNIYTLDGNLKMASWIRQHKGEGEWNTSEVARNQSRSREFVIEIPVGRWSEKVDISHGVCHITTEKDDVWVRGEDGHEVNIHYTPHTSMRIVQYMVTTEPPDHAKIRCS